MKTSSIIAALASTVSADFGQWKQYYYCDYDSVLYDQFELESRYGMKECRDWCAEATNDK